MDRWTGIMKVPLYPYSRARYRVAASLCLSPSYSSRIPAVPSTNVIFFNGDRVEGTGNPVIENLSDLKTITEILVSKLGDSINAWVIEASTFNGAFAIYKDFIPSVNRWGEPQSYDAAEFAASKSIVLLLSNCLKEASNLISDGIEKQCEDGVYGPRMFQPKTILFGFSKGGTVLNQIMTELAFSEFKSTKSPALVNEPLITGGLERKENQIIPTSNESFLDSISEIHFVDVGLNSAGAYLTDSNVIQSIYERLLQGDSVIRFVFHGTPRQWCDRLRVWIREEKDALVQLLKSKAEKSEGKLYVCERLYFADSPPNLQMHFQIIEVMNVS